MFPPYWNEAKTHLTAACPLLGAVIAAYPGEGLTSRGDAFYTLARSIAGQQISVKAADSVWKKVEATFQNSPLVGEPQRSSAKRDDQCVGGAKSLSPHDSASTSGLASSASPRGGSITPEAIMALSDAELRACGLSGQKVNYFRSLSEHFIERGITEHYWRDMSDAEVIRDLTSIKGIGVWTAEMFLIFHLLRPDVFPLADIGLQKGLNRLYAHLPKLKKAKEGKARLQAYQALGKRFEPYRTVATWYLWRSLDPMPVEY